MRPIGTAAINAPVTELIKSKGMNCGTATTAPHQSSVFKGKRWQRRPNTMKVGMKEAPKMAFHWPHWASGICFAGGTEAA